MCFTYLIHHGALFPNEGGHASLPKSRPGSQAELCGADSNAGGHTSMILKQYFFLTTTNVLTS